MLKHFETSLYLENDNTHKRLLKMSSLHSKLFPSCNKINKIIECKIYEYRLDTKSHRDLKLQTSLNQNVSIDI